MMKKKPTRPFNTTSRELLKDPKVAAEYLEEILADGNMELFTAALKDVADARLGGVSALSKKTNLNRQQLYKTLSKNGNPRLNTLSEVLHAIGLRMSVTPDIRP
jgi:probable addiction module antidote protein